MRARACFLTIVVLFPSCGLAQDFPTRTITSLVGNPPGGNVDLIARYVSSSLQAKWGMPVVVENKPGASETIGAEAIARSAADGYTVGYFSSAFAINESAAPQKRYAGRDLIPVAKLAEMPFVIAVRSDHPAQSLHDLVRMAKAQPGKMSYGHIGATGPHFLTMEWFKKAAGIDVLAVPYRGTPMAIAGLLAGEVDVMVVAGSSTPLIESGKLRALAAMADKRPPAFASLATVRELGYPKFELVPWAGAFVRAGTPEGIIQLQEAEILKIVQTDEFRTKMLPIGVDAAPLGRIEFGRIVARDIETWGSIYKDSDVKSQ